MEEDPDVLGVEGAIEGNKQEQCFEAMDSHFHLDRTLARFQGQHPPSTSDELIQWQGGPRPVHLVKVIGVLRYFVILGISQQIYNAPGNGN